MSDAIRKLASLRLTFAGLAWLVLHSIAISQWPEATIPWLVLPLGLLALNLLAAILANRTFRNQAALLLFHVGLLGVVVLVAAGILVRFDGRLEIVEGQAFDPAAVVVQSRGWLHRDALRDVEFVQGPVAVQYVSGLRRGATRSELALADGHATNIGDLHTYTSQGYRFKATFNKGFALLLHWQGADGGEALGAVNLPSYPEFEWKQRNAWMTPAGELLTLELGLHELVPHDSPWTLSSEGVGYYVTVIKADGGSLVLKPGESVAVDGGRITVADLRLWMGYRVDYDPFLPWLLAAAFLSLGALAVHVQQKYNSARDTMPARAIGRRLEA
jgi:cytochrome c biogenesis protein